MHPSDVLDMPVDPNEPTYCLCHQVSYGEMIGCDNTDVSCFVLFIILIGKQNNSLTYDLISHVFMCKLSIICSCCIFAVNFRIINSRTQKTVVSALVFLLVGDHEQFSKISKMQIA